MRARFGEFVLDFGTRTLTCAGAELHLSNRAFILLEYLVRNAPNAMTKEALYRHVWGETIVEEANLSNLVSELRGILGDTRKNRRYLKTFHGYGYAFVAEVSTEEGSESSSTRRSGSLFSLFWRSEEIPLREGRHIVGRGEGAGIFIDSVSVSRSHAAITVTGREAVIEDLGSKNGTYVRGEQIEALTELHDGDEIRIGVVSLSLRAINRGGTTATNLPVRD